MVIFINQTWFKSLVKARWNEAQQRNSNILTNVTKFIDDNSQPGQQPVYEYTRALWGLPSRNESSKNELCTDSKNAAEQSQQASANYLKEWLTARWNAVQSIINGFKYKNLVNYYFCPILEI